MPSKKASDTKVFTDEIMEMGRFVLTHPARWIGIDPGKSGGIAYINEHYEIKHWKIPATEKDLESVLCECKSAYGRTRCYIEKVSSSPQMGVKSAFTFGKGYGTLLGMLTVIGIPFQEVSPQRWQKALDCMSKGDKNVTKRKAQQLWPDEKITHAVADAMLIAKHCYDTWREWE